MYICRERERCMCIYIYIYIHYMNTLTSSSSSSSSSSSNDSDNGSNNSRNLTNMNSNIDNNICKTGGHCPGGCVDQPRAGESRARSSCSPSDRVASRFVASVYNHTCTIQNTYINIIIIMIMLIIIRQGRLCGPALARRGVLALVCA